ncbi:MAG: hypothetical protein AAF226_19585, partial [Verrucomicrobiota bacterium]
MKTAFTKSLIGTFLAIVAGSSYGLDQAKLDAIDTVRKKIDNDWNHTEDFHTVNTGGFIGHESFGVITVLSTDPEKPRKILGSMLNENSDHRSLIFYYDAEGQVILQEETFHTGDTSDLRFEREVKYFKDSA